MLMKDLNPSEVMKKFALHLSSLDRNKQTIRRHIRHIESFISYFGEYEPKAKLDITCLSQNIIKAYQKELARCISSTEIRYRHLISLRLFLRWTAERGYILLDLSVFVLLPLLPKSVIFDVLSVEEMKRLLSLPDIRTLAGIRDKAILEVLCGTGLRAGELSSLRVKDIDFVKETLLIHSSKNGDMRVTPISRRALDALKNLIDAWQTGEPESSLFFSVRGRRKLKTKTFPELIKIYLKKAGIDKKGGVHLFRHSFATSLMDNGCGIHHIQKMLGHRSLNTTQRYTHVSIKKLKEIHQKTHPRENKK